MKFFFIIVLTFCCLQAQNKVIYVSIEGAGLKDGGSWGNACAGLKGGILMAQNGDEVWLKSGVFVCEVGNNDSCAILITKNISVLGGFNGNETDQLSRNFKNNPTYLKSKLSGNGYTTSMYSYFLFDEKQIDGFTLDGVIFDGSLEDTANYTAPSGFCSVIMRIKTALIRNCVFINFDKTWIFNTTYLGGSSIIESCTFEKLQCSFPCISCDIKNIKIGVFNCLFKDCYFYWGVILLDRNFGQVANNTFIRVGVRYQGLFRCYDSKMVILNNCFVKSNSDSNEGIIFVSDPSVCNIQNNASDVDLETDENQFVPNLVSQIDPTGYPLHNSTLIDQGVIVPGVTDLYATDLNGKNRIINGKIDIGAYEYMGSVILPPDFTYNNTCQLTVFIFTNGNSFTAPVWDFGDGQTANTLNPSHSYAVTGVYTVVLTVVNTSGQKQTISKDISVYALPTKPVVRVLTN